MLLIQNNITNIFISSVNSNKKIKYLIFKVLKIKKLMAYNGNFPSYSSNSLILTSPTTVNNNNTQIIYYHPQNNAYSNYTPSETVNNYIYQNSPSKNFVINSGNDKNYSYNYITETNPISNIILGDKQIFISNNQNYINNINQPNHAYNNNSLIQYIQPHQRDILTEIGQNKNQQIIQNNTDLKQSALNEKLNDSYTSSYCSKTTPISQNHYSNYLNLQEQIINKNNNNLSNPQNLYQKQNIQIQPNEIKGLNQYINQNQNVNQKNIFDNNQIISKPTDNTQNKDANKINNKADNNIAEITNEISNLQIEKKEIQKRPLSTEDYKNIYLSGVGIINLGNTCFINSTLQVLIHCKLFIQNFLKKYSIINKETTPISYQFLLICIAMLDKMETNELYIDISNFKEVFGKKHPIFNDYSQNDSQEFCRIFLEDLSMELNEAKNKNVYKALTNTEGKSKLFRDREFDFNFKERESSIITELFYSQIINTFRCKCGSEIYSFQKLLDFPLLIPANVDKINIHELLKIYFKIEKIIFETKCERCHKIEEHIKLMRISRPPEILIISLQRIDEIKHIKNDCVVEFPQFLNLYEYMDHQMGLDKEFEYKLFSVVNHQGNVDFGHYFSYIQPLSSKNWFEFNDSSVKHIKQGVNNFPYAYALFYIKKKYLSD